LPRAGRPASGSAAPAEATATKSAKTAAAKTTTTTAASPSTDRTLGKAIEGGGGTKAETDERENGSPQGRIFLNYGC